MTLAKFVKPISCIFVVVTLLSTFSQSQWVRIPSPQASAMVSAMASSGQQMYVGTWRGMAVSSDNGISWKKCHISETDTSIESIVTAGETIIVGIRNKGFLISTDKGGHWREIDSIFPGKHIQRVTACAGVVLARDDESTFISFDNGVTWRDDQLGKKVNALAAFGSIIVAATNSHGIYRTSDSGKTWIKVNGSPNFGWLTTSGNLLFGSSDQGLFRSSDSGQTWVNIKSAAVSNVVVFDSLLVAAPRDSNCVLRSSDNGITWEKVTIDDSQPDSQSFVSGQLLVHNSKLYIAGNRGLFQSGDSGRTWNHVVIGLLDDSQPIAFNVNLQRSNNSEAFVEFRLTSAQQIKVTVCSPTGRVIKTLVNKHLEVGSYSYRWDLRLVGAGGYFIKMESASGIQTKKFMK